MNKIVGIILASLVYTAMMVNTSVTIAKDAMEAKNAIEFLVSKLASKDRDVRQEAVSLLGQTGSSKAVPILIKSLQNDPDWLVREKAAYALGTFKSKPSIKALSQALGNDVVGYVRSASAKSLGKIQTEVSISILTTLIRSRKEQDWRVRIVIVKLLGGIKTDDAVQALKVVVKQEQSPDVKEEAQKQLEAMGS